MSEPAPPARMELWIEERHRETMGMRFRVRRVLFSGTSEFQRIEVVETESLGRMLLNDGMVMVTERDEFVYHEMIAHVPLFTHPRPESVLIIGGGDGGTAREVLRHPMVTRCVMVEIDGMVVEACREHIPQTAGSLDDPRLELRIEDGVKYMAETGRRFDVILVDSTDPVGPATPLFGSEFYGDVHRVLADDGIVVAQGESPFYDPAMQAKVAGIFRERFPRVHFYNYTNLTYPGGLWSFALGSKGPCPIRDLDPKRVEKSGLAFSYYSADLHRGAFAIPAFQRRHLGEALSPLPAR